MNKWISVDDKMPEDFERVIVTDGNGVWEASFNVHFFWHGEECLELRKWTYRNNIDQILENITHWMPFPNPPIQVDGVYVIEEGAEAIFGEKE
jgi:hypothetical protein